MYVGLLTNSDGQFTSVLRDCGVYQPFDPCLISSEIDVRKPDLKAYELLLLKLNLPAGEVIFIDDRAENIEAAKKLGLDGILFKSHQQLEKELIQRKVIIRKESSLIF